MKKILCYIDELGSGGAERQMCCLACQLKKQGYVVDVYCYHPIYFYEYYLIENKINLIKEKTSPKNLFEKFRRSRRVIKKGNYDVVIAYAPGAVKLTLFLKLLGYKFKLLVSDRTTTPVPTTGQNILYNLYRLADYVVPNSYAQAKILESHYPFLKKKIYPITNTTDVNAFKPKESYDVSDTLKVICIGRHSPIKNVPVFLAALKILKDKGIHLHVTWIGNINTPTFKSYKDLPVTLGVSEMIKFLPHTHDIAQFYTKADVICHPSILEGFSNVISEAMCSGLPVLCGKNVGDNSVLVEDGVNGFLFNSYSAESIAESIIHFSSLSKAERMEMGRQSRLRAEKMLSAETFVNKYINLIES